MVPPGARPIPNLVTKLQAVESMGFDLHVAERNPRRPERRHRHPVMPKTPMTSTCTSSVLTALFLYQLLQIRCPAAADTPRMSWQTSFEGHQPSK